MGKAKLVEGTNLDWVTFQSPPTLKHDFQKQCFEDEVPMSRALRGMMKMYLMKRFDRKAVAAAGMVD